MRPVCNPDGNWCFTHHDPLEDTESHCGCVSVVTPERFTHHDPLEDTERSNFSNPHKQEETSFTHHDPLEDTERQCRRSHPRLHAVSPITIRLRILKEVDAGLLAGSANGFTHHDPLEDTESGVADGGAAGAVVFHPSRSA